MRAALALLAFASLAAAHPAAHAAAHAAAHPAAHAAAHPAAHAAPPARELHTRTTDVEALAWHDGTLYVATRGGLEAYAAGDRSQRRLFTTEDGLAANAVRALSVEDGQLVARTDRARCVADGARFVCEPAAKWPTPVPAISELAHGARVTARLDVPGLGGARFVGTAGAGVFLDGPSPTRLTPDGQICSNHIMAVEAWRGRVYFASFAEGLCVRDGATFVTLATPFGMVNDLAATPAGLYVAATEGLFVTTDGVSFAPVSAVSSRGVNDLAFDGKNLYATTPGALFRIKLPGVSGKRDRAYWRPGGTRALQAVDVRGGKVWLASEDRGALRLERGGWTIFDRAAGLPTSWALDVTVLPDGGALVATLRDGVIRIAADGTTASVAAPDPWTLHVSADGNGAFIGAQGGAARLGDDLAPDAFAALPDPNVHAVRRAAGRIWLATEGGLLALPAR